MADINETHAPVATPTPTNGSRSLFTTTVRHPAAWLFAGLYVLSVIYLIVTGHANFLVLTVSQLTFTVISLLIVLPLTRNAPAPAWEEARPMPTFKLWLQLVLALVSIVVALVGFFALTPLVLKLGVPLRVYQITFALMAEVVIPLVVVVLLGANLRELGFGRGYHSWRVTGALALVFLLVTGVLFLGGWAAPGTLLLNAILSFFTAGLPEETLVRGIFMTRLCRLFGTPWGICLSALIFGLLHIGNFLGGVNLPTALAISIIGNAVGGLGAAIIFLRTRNLLAGVVTHSIADSVGQPIQVLLKPFLG